MPLTPHTLLAKKYRIEAVIGQGAYGRVYRARDVKLDRVVAIKELHKGEGELSSTAYADYARRFRREAKVQARFNHPHIVHVYELLELTPDNLYLVMECVDGGTLKELIERKGVYLPLADAVRLTQEILQGLAHVHADPRDIVHRDIKPSNILLTQDGHAKISDFGLAQVGDESMRSGSGEPHPGTAMYMSPEQETTSAYLYPQSDLFSAGCVLFELLTGVPYKKAKRSRQTLRDLRPEVPTTLDELITQALLKDYDARPESAEAMAQMLRDDDPRSHTKEHEENKQEAPIRTIAPGKQTQATALKETLDTAIRLNEWEEAERVLNELSQLAPDDSSLTIYRKRVEREMQPIREGRKKTEEAEAKRKAEEVQRKADEEAKRKATEERERLLAVKWITIPAGEFLYGDKKEKKTLPAFQIAKTPVTNVQYYQFVKATKHDSPSHWQNGQVPQGLEDHPVVYVSWDDAQEFCKWAKCRLPTEEEWEKAARGTDGRSYPWGNEQPTKTLCNFNNNEKGTTPVGKYSPQGDSPYGCVDMSGNVWEWTESAYVSNTRVLRGGSFYRNQRYVRSAYRGGSRPRNRDYGYGFRVVVSSGSRP